MSQVILAQGVTRFTLDELEELGSLEAWTVLHVPAKLDERIQFREIGSAELNVAYQTLKREISRGIFDTPQSILGQT